MINLFENYNQETQELHQSLKHAGYNHFTIVINDDGFLPDDVTSPYRFFAAYQIYEDDTPAFFNDIDTPPFGKLKEMRQWLPLQIWVSLEVKSFIRNIIRHV